MAGIPLKLNGSETSGPSSQNPTLPAGTLVYTLKEMTSSEIQDGIVYRILAEFAKTDLAAPKTGELTLSDTVGDVSTNVIGDYVDTNRVYDVGVRGIQAGGISRTVETSTTVYQVLTTVTENIIRPLCFRDGNLCEMTDTEIMDTIITPALDRMTNRGLGSYHFCAGTPKDTNGNDLPGTWTSVLSVTDNYKSGNIMTNWPVYYVNNTIQPPTGPSVINYVQDANNWYQYTIYRLYRKTEETAPATQLRPLKYDNTADRGKHITEMTNADIIRLVARFRNQIITTGKGKYVFQANSPSSGTWGKRGDNIVDMLNQIDQTTYTWGFTRTQTRNYTGQYNSPFVGDFTQPIAGPGRTQYFGGWSPFDGSSTTYVPYYTRHRYETFLAPFTSIVAKNFINVTLQYYTAIVVSPTALIQNNDYLWVKRAN